jgi:hypothetical protein
MVAAADGRLTSHRSLITNHAHRRAGSATDEDENMPVWPTRAVGVLSGVPDVETCNRRRLSHRPLRLRVRSIPHIPSRPTYNHAHRSQPAPLDTGPRAPICIPVDYPFRNTSNRRNTDMT